MSVSRSRFDMFRFLTGCLDLRYALTSLPIPSAGKTVAELSSGFTGAKFSAALVRAYQKDCPRMCIRLCVYSPKCKSKLLCPDMRGNNRHKRQGPEGIIRARSSARICTRSRVEPRYSASFILVLRITSPGKCAWRARARKHICTRRVHTCARHLGIGDSRDL